jgi:hypothetical protein
MPMASADLSRRVQKVVAYPPLSDIAAASVASSTKRCSTPTASKTSLASGRGRSSTQSRTGRSCGLSRTPSPLAPSRDRRARRDRCLSVSDGLAGPNLGQGRPRASDLDELPPRIDTPLLFPAPHGGLLNLDNFRRREWAPAIEAAAIARPARIYDLRSTFASNALAAGVTARSRYGNLGADDRAPLRSVDRRRSCGHRRAPRCDRDGARGCEGGEFRRLGHLWGTAATRRRGKPACARKDSNLRPLAPEANALSPELRARSPNSSRRLS